MAHKQNVRSYCRTFALGDPALVVVELGSQPYRSGSISQISSGSRTWFVVVNSLPSAEKSNGLFDGVNKMLALGVPSFRQRIYSADNVATVKKTFYTTSVLYFLFCFIPAIIGICAYRINPGLEQHDHAFLFMANDVMPMAIGLIVLMAGLSATMSSASSDAIAAVSILLRDIYIMFTGRVPNKHKMIGNTRWGLVGITIVALAVTLPADDIIKYIQDMISFVLSGLVVCTIMGKYWRRATWQGGVAAILGGGLCTLVFKLNEPWDSYWGGASIPSVVCAAAAGIAVSLLTPPNTVPDEQALKVLAQERQAMEMREETPDPEMTS